MPRISTKFLIGSGSVGTIGGVGYLVSVLTNTTESLDNYLTRNNLTPRTKGWETVAETYLLEAVDENLKIDGSDVMKPEQIKEWCDLTLKGGMEPDNDLEVKIASKWCMEYKTIKDNFPKDKELITEASEFKSKYQGLQDGELKKSIDAVDLKESPNSGEEKFKKWCADNSNRTASERNKFFIDNISTHCLKDKKGK